VLQLDGGILRYFDAVPAAPQWRGRCVVFDERESVSAAS
jgi:predicted sulfurtransferase